MANDRRKILEGIAQARNNGGRIQQAMQRGMGGQAPQRSGYSALMEAARQKVMQERARGIQPLARTAANIGQMAATAQQRAEEQRRARELAAAQLAAQAGRSASVQPLPPQRNQPQQSIQPQQTAQTRQPLARYSAADLAAAINDKGTLPKGTRWLNRGDEAVVVRDLVHLPLAGVTAPQQENADIDAEKKYRDAVAKANAAYSAPVDKYGSKYGDVYHAWQAGQRAVANGETDPEYTAYHARMGEQLAEINALHDEAEALRPEWMEDQLLRSTFESGSKANPGWDRSNKYDENPQLRSQMWSDQRTLQGQRDQLAGQIQQLEAQGYGNNPNMAGLRDRLGEMDRQLEQMGYIALEGREGYHDVVANAKKNGYRQGSNTELLRAVVDTDKMLEEAVAKSGSDINLPKELDLAAEMTPQERDRFIYLWETDEDAAARYFASLEGTINQRRSQRLQDKAYRMANGSPLGALGMLALDAVSTPVKGIGLLETAYNAMTGQETDPYSSAFALNHLSSGAVQGAKEQMVAPLLGEGGKETIGSKAAGLAFDVLHSAGANLANAAMLGPLALPAMGLASGAETANESLIRTGGDSLKSALNGGASALAEIATEKLPMDRLGDMLAGKTKGLGSILAQGLMEAPGEMINTILSNAADREIMGAYSNYNLAVESMVANNVPREEAEATAARDFWREVGYSGLVGWLSGSVSGAAAQGIANLSDPGAAEPTNLSQGIENWKARQAAEVAQQQPSGSEAKVAEGSVQDKLQQAAEAAYAQQQQQTAQQQPVQLTESEDGKTNFAKPMQALTVDGDAVQLIGIDEDSDGRAYLRVADAEGNVRSEPVEAVSVQDETVQDLLAAEGVRSLPAQALSKYLADYDSSVPADVYAEAYGYVYRRGAANYTYEDATANVTREILPEQALMDAYTTGLSQYHHRNPTEAVQPVEAPVQPAEGGEAVQPVEVPVQTAEATMQQPTPGTGRLQRSYTREAWYAMEKDQRRKATAQLAVVESIANRFGVSVNVVDSISTPDGQHVNGRYNRKTGQIEIALNADAGAYAYVAMHELTHDIKNRHSGQWEAFSDLVTDALLAKGEDVDAMIAYQREAFGYDVDTALEEVVCNTAPAILQDENVLMDLYRKDRTLFERVMDWVKTLVDDIRQVGKDLSSRSRSWAQMDALAGDREYVEQIYRKMEEIYRADGVERVAGWTVEQIEQEVVEGMVPSVMEAPVDADGNAVRYSVSTYQQEMPKPMGVARAKALGFDTRAVKDGGSIARLGRNGKRTLMASGREVTEALLKKEGHSKKTIRKVLGYMDKVNQWYRDNVGKYQYVNLADVNDANIIVDRKTGQILFSCQVPNGEYKVNFDFTTVCRQREAIQRFVDELSAEQGKRGSKLEDISLSQDNIFRLNTMLKDAGYETACLGCFVEAKRYRIMSQANTIVSEWNEAVRAVNPEAGYFDFARADYQPSKDEIIKLDESMSKYTSKGTGAKTPTQRAQTLINKVPEMQKLLRPSDIISRDGRRAIREFNPHLESFVVSRFGTAGAKPAVGFMPYNGEIAALPDTKRVDGKTISYAEYLATMGGGRTNSFSDFVVTHALDYLQRTVDMAARGFSGQCYTKVLGRAMLFGMTGEKVNLSVMFDIDPNQHWSNAGLDADGNYIVADKARADRMEAEGKGRTFTQSIPFAEAVEIEHDPRYADNCGIIGVGYSYNHIAKMIEDGDIPYIIPYHRSGMPESVAKASNTALATNYEAVQNTTKIVGYQRVYNMDEANGVPSYATWPEGKKRPRKVDMSYDFGEAMQRTGSATATMQEWLQWMSDNQLTPMTASGEAGHGSFPLYETLEETKSPEATAEAYIRYCIEKGELPVFYEFSGMDGYYKTLFDFSVKNLATGEVATQKPMSFDWMDTVPVEDFLQELEAESYEYDEYMKSRYGEGSKWQEIKQRAYEELQPKDGDEVWANSMSDYDETVQESEEVMRDLLVMTAAHRMTDAEAERMAKKVLGVAKGTMDTVELAKRLKNTFDYATRTGENLDLNGLNAEVLSIAQQVMDSSLTIDQAHEAEVKELRSYLRSTKIALTDTQQKEAASLMGSYANYRRATFGRANINKNGVPLDSLWSSLTEMNPVLFPADATEGDMVQILLDASMSVSPVYINELGLNAEESRQWLAHEIYNAYMSLNGVQRAAKEKQALDLKLSDYRRLTKRFAAEHSAAFDEALAKVKAENAADLTRYKAEADAEAGRKILQKVEQVEEEYRLRENAINEMAETRIANMAEYVQAMEIKNSAYVRNVRDKLEGAIRRRSYRERIYKATNDILKKVEEPSDKKHVAQGLEGTLIEFLRALQNSLSGRHYKKVANLSWRMTQAAVALERAEDNDAVVVDPELVEEMHQLAAELEGYDNIFKLSTERLQDVANMVEAAAHILTRADDRLLSNNKKRVGKLAEGTLAELSERKDVRDLDGWLGKFRDMLSIGQMDAFHFFDMLGNSARDVFAELREGLNRKINHEAEAMEYAADAMRGLTAAQRRELTDKNAKKIAFELDGGTLEFTKAQIMSLYCTDKRKQAQEHLYGSSSTTAKRSFGIRAGDGARARIVEVTPEDVARITGTLTAEEKALADKLQRFLANECAKWGNETSLQMYGYKKYREQDYYPLRVDPATVKNAQSEEAKRENLYAIANQGFTKALMKHANNALYIDDIFTVFSRHVGQMATYNGYAAPIIDMVRWYNYQSEDGSTGVMRMLENKFGQAGREFVPTLIRNLNGERDRSYDPGISGRLLSTMKASSVGRNLRVVIQQPTAILRAGDMLGYRYIAAGMLDPRKPGDRTKLREAVELAAQYSPIAHLKQMGYYETDIGPGLRTAMFDDRNAMDKVLDEGMWLAGKMDEMTFGMLWRACEAETRALHPELTGEELYKATGKRLSDVIDYTQVVDTTLHRSQLMRSNNALVRMSTTFLSEPTKTYNMIVGSLRNLLQNRKDPIAKKRFVRTIGAFALTGILNAAAQSLIDAIRDGEDEEWWRKYLKHFFGDYSNLGEGWYKQATNAAKQALLEGNLGSNLNVLTMVPYVKDALSLMQGYDLNRTDMQSVEKLVQTAQQVGKLATGESKLSGWGWAKQVASSVDAVTGLGLSNALRDGYAFTGLLFGAMGMESPISMQAEDATTTIAYDNLYKALTSGNEASWRRLASKMLAKGKTQKDIDTAMAERLMADERIEAAYTAKEAGRGSEVDRIRTELMRELPEWMSESRRREIVDKAISRKAPTTDTTATTSDKPLNSKLFAYDDLGTALVGMANGTHSRADYDLIASELLGDSDAQDPAKNLQTQAKSKAKAAYLAATPAQRKRLAEVIKEVLGLDDKTISGWLEK